MESSVRMEIGSTRSKFIYNKSKSMLCFETECTNLPLKYFKPIYILCMCLSIHPYLGRQFPKGLSHFCPCCTYDCPLFQTYFARMSI